MRWRSGEVLGGGRTEDEKSEEEDPFAEEGLYQDEDDGDEYHAPADPLGTGRQLGEQAVGAQAGVLAQTQLQEEQGQACQEKHEQVGDQEASPSLQKMDGSSIQGSIDIFKLCNLTFS